MAIVAFALHDKIVNALAPYAQQVAEYPGSWLVPVTLLIIVSFPPLFGHELIAILTGFVWSMPVAFLLVFTGSIIGESLLFLSFRHFFHSRIVQFRKEHEQNYGTIVLVISEHKRWMVFLIRLSAIPGHFSTPLFSSIDEIEYREWLYMVIATSWKFGIPVYLGHLLANHQTSWVGTILVFFTSCVTIVVAWYLYRQFHEYKRRPDRMNIDMDQGETEFEISSSPRVGKGAERTALVGRASDDDFFFDEEEAIGH